MKKLIILALTCLLVASANAQFSFGIKAGFNQNSVYTRHSPDFGGYKSMAGFHVGLYSQFHLTDKLSINPELQYIKKGPENYRYFNLNYLEIPVLFNYQVWKSLTIEFGPTIGAPIFGRNYNNSASWVDMSFAEYALDAGVVIGLKCQLTKKVSLVSRYNQSFLQFDYYTYNPSGTSTNLNYDVGKAYLKNVQFSVMYKLK